MTKNLKNKRESEKELTEKAILLVPQVLDAAQKFGQSFCEGKNYQGADKAEVYLEAIYFLLHLVDRKVFNLMGPEKRDIVMDNMFLKIKEDLLSSIESAKRQYVEEIISSTYYFRQREYSNYVWGKDPSTGMKDDLLWEFGNVVANMLDKPKDFAFIWSAIGTMVATVKYCFPNVEEHFATVHLEL